jgi:hypothetical protein
VKVLNSTPLLLLFSGLLINCALRPDPLISYRNQDPEGFWHQGRAVHRYQEDTLEFRVACEKASPQSLEYLGNTIRSLSFQLEIRNYSNRVRLIDPAAFGIKTWEPGTEMFLLDPEIMINQAESNLEYALREEALATEKLEAIALEALVDEAQRSILVTDSIQQKKLLERLKNRVDAESSLRKTRKIVHAWEQVKRNLSESLLRKNSLDPGTKLTGTIYFRLPPETNPDSLLLSYRLPGGKALNLGHFHIFRDSSESVTRL